MVARLRSNWNSHALLGATLNVTATLKNGLTVSNKVKHILIWLSHSMPRYLPKRNDSICPHKAEYTNGHSSIMGNRQTLETTGEQINKSCCICTMELLLSNRKKRTTKTHNVDAPPNHYAEWQQPDTKNTCCVMLFTSNSRKWFVPWLGQWLHNGPDLSKCTQ